MSMICSRLESYLLQQGMDLIKQKFFFKKIPTLVPCFDGIMVPKNKFRSKRHLEKTIKQMETKMETCTAKRILEQPPIHIDVPPNFIIDTSIDDNQCHQHNIDNPNSNTCNNP
eukprot:333338_1